MHRKLILFLVASFPVWGQAPEDTQEENKPVVGSSHAGNEWEYLVIGERASYFTSAEEEANSTLRHKTSSEVSTEFTGRFKEAVGTQNRLDELGKLGWELISMSGAVGGDLIMTFKRPVKPRRPAAVVALDTTTKTTTRLIDLDEVEAIAMASEKRNNEEKKIRTLLESIKDYPVNTSIQQSAMGTVVNVVVQINDSILSDAGEYRRSQAETLSRLVGESVKTKFDLKPASSRPAKTGLDEQVDYALGKVKVNLSFVVVFEGETKIVSRYRFGGNWE